MTVTPSLPHVINEFRLAKNSQANEGVSGCTGNELLGQLGVSLGGRTSPSNQGAPQVVMQNFGRAFGLTSSYTAFDKNVLGGQQGGESTSDGAITWHLREQRFDHARNTSFQDGVLFH